MKLRWWQALITLHARLPELQAKMASGNPIDIIRSRVAAIASLILQQGWLQRRRLQAGLPHAFCLLVRAAAMPISSDAVSSHNIERPYRRRCARKWPVRGLSCWPRTSPPPLPRTCSHRRPLPVQFPSGILAKISVALLMSLSHHAWCCYSSRLVLLFSSTHRPLLLQSPSKNPLIVLGTRGTRQVLSLCLRGRAWCTGFPANGILR